MVDLRHAQPSRVNGGIAVANPYDCIYEWCLCTTTDAQAPFIIGRVGQTDGSVVGRGGHKVGLDAIVAADDALLRELLDLVLGVA